MSENQFSTKYWLVGLACMFIFLSSINTASALNYEPAVKEDQFIVYRSDEFGDDMSHNKVLGYIQYRITSIKDEGAETLVKADIWDVVDTEEKPYGAFIEEIRKESTTPNAKDALIANLTEIPTPGELIIRKRIQIGDFSEEIKKNYVALFPEPYIITVQSISNNFGVSIRVETATEGIKLAMEASYSTTGVLLRKSLFFNMTGVPQRTVLSIDPVYSTVPEAKQDWFDPTGGLADDIDTVMRIALIAIFFFFSIYMINMRKKALEMPAKANFYLMFSLFFFFTGLNFLLTEIDLYFIRFDGDSIFPEIISSGDEFFIISPRSSDVFLTLFFLLSVVPMLFALEKTILQKEKPIIAYAASVGLILNVIIVFVHQALIVNLVMIYAYLALVLLTFRIVFIYLSLAFKGVGDVRVMAAMMGFGFILILLGIVATSLETLFGDFSEAAGHGISLIGTIFIFFGVLKLK
jgi:hypothetical protein